MADALEFAAYISPALRAALKTLAQPVPGVAGMTQIGAASALETTAALEFVAALYAASRDELSRLLDRRLADRAFIDERVRALAQYNAESGHAYCSTDYQTILGLEDANGEVVFGPKRADYACAAGDAAAVAPLPEYLRGPHPTLFGTADSAAAATAALRSLSQPVANEPAIVAELADSAAITPKWGVDSEDSLTPLRSLLQTSAATLCRCFAGVGAEAQATPAAMTPLPIKRCPGLALPCMFLFQDDRPLPLHLYDFGLHAFHHWHDPRALNFYVPKLETEAEARYLRNLLATAESLLQARHSSYQRGSIRLIVVLENPRAIFRVHEIIDALHPYFAGASLGWHDFLAATGRLFKEDPNYRMPLKSNPDIVVNHIRASHCLLASVVGSRGGLKIGGMFGVLPPVADYADPSFQVVLHAYIKDALSQLQRQLDGFWVAYPEFIRLGLALLAAWDKHRSGDTRPLRLLLEAVLPAPHAAILLASVEAEDAHATHKGTDPTAPLYARTLIVADLEPPPPSPAQAEAEARYNIFQCLQYLASWLSGQANAALPAMLAGQAVRVLDDLATTERSRWQLWHEVRHGRLAAEGVIRIAFEELRFIRKDDATPGKSVAVKWDEHTARWYPVACRLLVRALCESSPVEAISERLWPFLTPMVRAASDPWQALTAIDPASMAWDPYLERYMHWFECLGHQGFATAMAVDCIPDLAKGEALVQHFTIEDVTSAAAFHGDIGEPKRGLDAQAASEQAQVMQGDAAVRAELHQLGLDYKHKFGFKFLVSAQGRSAAELLLSLKERLQAPPAAELDQARAALWEIARKRFAAGPWREHAEILPKLRAEYGINAAMVSILTPKGVQDWHAGVDPHTWFEVASLSKSVAAAFAIEFFTQRGIALNSSVNALLATTNSSYRLPGPWGDQVSIAHLLSHKALNLHYVNGVPNNRPMPPLVEFLSGNQEYNYEPVAVVHPPGEVFQYSGGGFLVLEHLITALSGEQVARLTRPFLDALGMQDFSFEPTNIPGQSYADAAPDDGRRLPGGRLNFPAFAAGALGTSTALARFLGHLGHAWHDMDGSGPIAHDTARLMLHGTDQGCQEFMGCNMGLGVFVAAAGDNKLAIHQGANDGFRCLYIYCFSGPDRGKGVVSLCTGDLRGVLFNAAVAREMLSLLGMRGMDWSRIEARFDPSRLRPEEVVNIGYRDLVLQAFLPRLPEAIERQGQPEALAARNLATRARIVKVSNQLFGRAENLISPYAPTFDPSLFGKEGKIMDSWETVRHNPRPCDELIIELLAPAPIRYVSLSTRFHLGNQAAHIRLEGLCDGKWYELMPKVAMAGHALWRHDRGDDSRRYQQIRVENYPDGGLTRLGLYSDLPPAEARHYLPLDAARPEPYPDPIPRPKKPMVLAFNPTPAAVRRNQAHLTNGQLVNVASAALGATILHATNEHYAPAAQVLSPYPPLNMFDGLESARTRIKNHHEEVTVRLAQLCRPRFIIVDCRYFINNNPLELAIQAQVGNDWVEIVPRTLIKPFAGSQKRFAITQDIACRILRVQTFPDGGLNRLIVLAPWLPGNEHSRLISGEK